MTTKRKGSRSPPGGHAGKRGSPTRDESPCVVPDCGRPSYARGLCQTHHRQLMTDGRIKPIRRYRKRSPDTVRFAGFRLTRHCAEKLSEFARVKRIALSAAITEVLEEWARETKGRSEGM